MSLLNYSTSINASKTVGEIQDMLSRAKACAVLTEYEEGVLSAISFRMETAGAGLLSFRLPANIDSVYKVLVKDGRIPRKLRTREQASKVAWRIVKDWLAAQLAFVQSQQAEFEQVFLPYAQDGAGNTVFDIYRGLNFRQLQLH